MAFEAEVSKWFGDEQVRAKLGELRKTDPDKSMLARWELLPCGFLARFEQFFADRFHHVRRKSPDHLGRARRNRLIEPTTQSRKIQ